MRAVGTGIDMFAVLDDAAGYKHRDSYKELPVTVFEPTGIPTEGSPALIPEN
jgi:hypothetical protein